MLTKNWNIVDDDYFNDEEVRQREDAREAQYQQGTEKYKLSVNGLCLMEKPDKYGIAKFDKKPNDALIMHLPEFKRVIDILERNIAYGINVWHYRPIARLDVNTAKLMLDCVDENEKCYIVQHEKGWVSNDLFDRCYHWRIATPYTLEDAYRIAKAHRNLSETIGDCQEVWILRLGWVKERVEDVKAR